MRIILVHGFNASPEMNFHPWLAGELRNRGFEVVAPKLDLTLTPQLVGEGEEAAMELKLAEVIEQMRAQIGTPSNDDIFVGHSLGAFMILQYLERVETTETPRAVVMVAPPWKVSRPELRHLFIVDLDADVLMWKAREYVVIHSKDDKLVPIDHGRKLAEAFRARFVETETDGHFMDAQYPILLSTIEEIASRPFEYAPGQSLHDELANP